MQSPGTRAKPTGLFQLGSKVTRKRLSWLFKQGEALDSPPKRQAPPLLWSHPRPRSLARGDGWLRRSGSGERCLTQARRILAPSKLTSSKCAYQIIAFSDKSSYSLV